MSSLWDGLSLKTATPATPSQHAMGSHLYDYVAPKMHQLVRDQTWRLIVVIGKYDRTPPYIVADSEKRQKPFNWHRPTARVVDQDTLEVACFPGFDYIHHYALLIATYLALVGKQSTTVKYSEQVDSARGEAFIKRHLQELGQTDTVILGYVDRLILSSGQAWECGTIDHESLFAWKRVDIGDGQIITLLGCKISFWGDISTYIVKALRESGVKRLLYIGKAAALPPEIRPNSVCVTGNSSWVEHAKVEWENALRSITSNPSRVVHGTHITIASPLLANKLWIEDARSMRADWVDCEVGPMAKQCVESEVSFGYLHLVSDSLSSEAIYGLWNERDRQVELMRLPLLNAMSETLKYLGTVDGRSSRLMEHTTDHLDNESAPPTS